MGKYKGDSDGKRWARGIVTYVAMNDYAKLRGTASLRSMRAIVLAGHGGDISAMRALERELPPIMAVDTDRDCVERCRAQWPAEDYRTCPVEDVILSNGFDFCNLDFCGNMSADNVNLVISAVKNITLPGIVMVTMLTGRESKSDKAVPQAFSGLSRRWRRRAHAEIKKMYRKKGIAGESVFEKMTTEYSPIQIVKAMDKLGARRGDRVYQTRAMALAQMLTLAVPGRLPQLRAIVGYHSRCGKNGGQPFLTVAFAVVDTKKKHSIDALSRSPANGSIRFVCRADTRNARKWIREDCIKMRVDDDIDASGLFCVDRQTVAAWLAHDTMGTYN